jgi:hypothetical protein
MNRSKSFLFPRIHHPTRLGPTGRLPRKFPYAPTVNSVFPQRDRFSQHASQTVCLLSISVSTPKEKYPSVFFRSPSPPLQLLLSGTLCVTSHPTPQPQPHRMERICFSVALQIFQSSFSIHYHYSISSFFVLHSAFFPNKRTLITPAPAPPCRFMCCCVACADGVYGLVWVQTV